MKNNVYHLPLPGEGTRLRPHIEMFKDKWFCGIKGSAIICAGDTPQEAYAKWKRVKDTMSIIP